MAKLKNKCTRPSIWKSYAIYVDALNCYLINYYTSINSHLGLNHIYFERDRRYKDILIGRNNLRCVLLEVK